MPFLLFPFRLHHVGLHRELNIPVKNIATPTEKSMDVAPKNTNTRRWSTYNTCTLASQPSASYSKSKIKKNCDGSRVRCRFGVTPFLVFRYICTRIICPNSCAEVPFGKLNFVRTLSILHTRYIKPIRSNPRQPESILFLFYCITVAVLLLLCFVFTSVGPKRRLG